MIMTRIPAVECHPKRATMNAAETAQQPTIAVAAIAADLELNSISEIVDFFLAFCDIAMYCQL